MRLRVCGSFQAGLTMFFPVGVEAFGWVHRKLHVLERWEWSVRPWVIVGVIPTGDKVDEIEERGSSHLEREHRGIDQLEKIHPAASICRYSGGVQERSMHDPMSTSVAQGLRRRVHAFGLHVVREFR